MNSKTSPTAPEQRSQQVNPYSITAGLLRNDLRLLPSLFLLLSFAAIAETVVAPSFWLMTVDRILQLTVMCIVLIRWRKRFQATLSPRLRTGHVVLRVFGIGLSLWILVTIAKTMTIASQALFEPNNSALPMVLGLVILALSLMWCLRLYFYYVIAGFLGGTWRDILSRALCMHRQAPGAAIRSLAAPLALTALASAVFTLPYPDGRSVFFAALASASQAIFWLLSTYTGLGFALSLLRDSDWRAAGVEGYSLQRLQTLETQGRSKFAAVLTPQSALKLTAAAVALLIVTSVRLATEPPSAQIEITRLIVKDRFVGVNLTATDPTFHFHGFKPALFSLRSKSGYPVSTDITKASTKPEEDEVMVELPSMTQTSTPLFLEFKTDRNANDLRALEDLWLWYGFVPLKAIEKDSLSASEKSDE